MLVTPVERREEVDQLTCGEDFDALEKEYSDDAHPGKNQMANFGVEDDMSPSVAADTVFPRAVMVGAFGNVGFPMDVGEIGMASHNPATSEYGWHIIRRIK